MDPQQQTRQTEKLIEKMLDFLECKNHTRDINENFAFLAASEEEEDVGTFSYNGVQDEHLTANDEVEQTKYTKYISPMKVEKEKGAKSTIAQELKKLNREFPIWNTKEIVSGHKKYRSLPQSPTCTDESIWRQSSLSLVDKSVGPSEDDVPQDYAENNKDWRPKFDTNCRVSSNNAYVQEVCRAIYGDTRGHPVNGSAEYYQAAQNYAIYGKEFLDFPQDMETILDDKVVTAGDTRNYNNGLYPSPPPLGQGLVMGYNSNEAAASVGVNSFVKPTNSTSAPICTTTTNAAVAATTAYYQLCNGVQPQTRPATGNATAALGATTYGMFLGNKLTYVAAAPTTVPQPLMYNQHTSHATTNFISNSLANAALATSPAILYSNPLLATTTQQYLNAFFKETQFLNTVAAAAAAGGGGGVNTTQANTTAAGIYERLVYAQMLQQQIYQQSQQQAAAVAAMLQHKQRINSAAAAAAARQTVMTNGANNSNGNTNGAQSCTSAPPTTSVEAATSSTSTPVNVNVCGRPTSQIDNNSPDLLFMKQFQSIPTNRTAMPVNGSEESSNIGKD